MNWAAYFCEIENWTSHPIRGSWTLNLPDATASLQKKWGQSPATFPFTKATSEGYTMKPAMGSWGHQMIGVTWNYPAWSMSQCFPTFYMQINVMELLVVVTGCECRHLDRFFCNIHLFFHINYCTWNSVSMKVMQWLSTLRLKYAYLYMQKMFRYHNLHQTCQSWIHIATDIKSGAETMLCDLGDHPQASQTNKKQSQLKVVSGKSSVHS